MNCTFNWNWKDIFHIFQSQWWCMWLASSRSLKYEIKTNVKRFWIFSDGRGSPGEVIEVKIKGCDGCYEGGGEWRRGEEMVTMGRCRDFPLQFSDFENCRPWPDWEEKMEETGKTLICAIYTESTMSKNRWKVERRSDQVVKIQNVEKIFLWIPLRQQLVGSNWQQVTPMVTMMFLIMCTRCWWWSIATILIMRFCRCFLEGGGSTDSFFVREDLQVENRN